MPCALGILKVLQTKRDKQQRNERIIAAPADDMRIQKLNELSKGMRSELQKFFIATHALENVTLEFLGWKGPAVANKTIRQLSLDSD